MPNPKAQPVVLSEPEREGVEKLVKRHQTGQQIALRARIVLAAAEGKPNVEIARKEQVKEDTVRLWRNRWIKLQAISVEDLSLEERLAGVPRPGAPARITADQRCRIEALACEHRTGRRGLGVSYLDGFKSAVSSDADLVVHMDADRSHDPQYLPAMIAAAAAADLVVGSRYMHGISVVNWPLRRIILSSFANAYIRLVTGLGIRDCTTGYRCWRREALAKLPLDRIASEGYSFVVEVTFLAAVLRLRIAESPIIFIERREGASKLSSGILLESLWMPWRLVLRHGRARGTTAGVGSPGYNSGGAPR